METKFRSLVFVRPFASSSEISNAHKPFSNQSQVSQVPGRKPHASFRTLVRGLVPASLILFLSAFLLSGCGSGGYPGGGLTSLTANVSGFEDGVNIDASQSIQLTVTATGGAITWGMNGCTMSNCGTLVGTSNTTATYSAPAVVPVPFTLTILASLANTSAQKTITVTVVPAPALAGAPAAGIVGQSYSSQLVITGGTTPTKFNGPVSGLPIGLSFDQTTGIISGVATMAGDYTLTVPLADNSDVQQAWSATTTLAIHPAAVTQLTVTGAPGAGVVGVPYAASLSVSGGTAPYSFSLIGGSLPPGLSMTAAGVILGTPTTAGVFPFTVQARDANGLQGDGSFSITVSASPLAILTSGLPNGTVNLNYSALVNVTGGTAPYTCTVLTGALPSGLSFGPGCTVVGIPTVVGSFTFTVKATDSSNPQLSATGVITVQILPTPLTITSGNLPNGTVNVNYSALVNVTGGTAPYTCSVVLGNLPNGLSFGPGCTVTGTPTVAGIFVFTVKVTDSSNPQLSATGIITIQILPIQLTIVTSNLPNGIVGTPYISLIGIAGGLPPYTCSIASGMMPAGLTLNANCTVTGTPLVAETETPIIRVVDSSNPSNTVSKPVSITITASPIALTVSGSLTALQGVPFAGAVIVTGGTAPYTCALASGSMPTGLTLNSNCTVTGMATTSGTFTVTVSATDSSNPPVTATGQVTITVQGSIVMVISSPPPATVGSPYTGTLSVSGGTAPYTCVLTGGTLPAGLALNSNCTVTGTPTKAGPSIITVKVTDSANPTNTTTGPVTVTVLPASVTLTLSSPPPAIVDQLYTGTIGVSGGTGPYTCTITGGTLPLGLVLGPNCIITGVPLVAGTVQVTVLATDSEVPAATITGPVSIVVTPAGLTLTPPSSTATISTPYTGTILVSGGTAPYSCVLASGTLPTGLTLGTNCVITGTPTTAGTFTFSVNATDSANPQASGSGTMSITVGNVPTLVFTGSLPNAIVGVAYTQTLTASGGVGPYTYALTTGALPAGMTLATDGTISGTPTAPGATSFTVTATDSESKAQAVSLPLVLLVVYPTTPQDSLLNGPYAFLFQGYDDEVAGVLSYQTATVGSFTADGTGILNNGELDSNHQSSSPTGATISTSGFLGTYTLGSDDRGYLTITTLNADGTTAATSTYSITVKAPYPPAKAALSGSMIEFDDNNLQGTKGSGKFLLQTPAAYTAGLSGSYAFGIQGDTPCLPSCGVGLSAGPVAAVGQFNADGNGNITSGTGDETIASTTYASSALSGTFGAADGNGRLQMSMTTLNMPAGTYPVDYAVYVVDASHAFVMSTDKHSSYVLLSGSATLQQGTFNNASMTGPYVGYENAQTNPGLVGATLQNVLNLSTSTIFRGTGNGTGTCTTTNVDMGGTTALVNGLTGLGSGSNVLNALLGTYQSTGNSTCTVAASGRGVLNYPVPGGLLTTTLQLLGLSANPPAPRVVYLYGPDQGYFLETGYAGLGQLQQQNGSPFTLQTLKGTFVYQTSPASSVVSTDTAGTFTSDGNGNVQTTYDLNVGLGTVNLLQPDVTGTSTYKLTDATAGRFLLGTTTVIYAISPSSFVVLDTNALITSPSFALLF